MVSKPRWTRHLSSLDLQLDHFLSKIAPSNTAPEAENLPLNTPSKGIVNQACLIN